MAFLSFVSPEIGMIAKVLWNTFIEHRNIVEGKIKHLTATASYWTINLKMVIDMDFQWWNGRNGPKWSKEAILRSRTFAILPQCMGNNVIVVFRTVSCSNQAKPSVSNFNLQCQLAAHDVKSIEIDQLLFVKRSYEKALIIPTNRRDKSFTNSRKYVNWISFNAQLLWVESQKSLLHTKIG